MSWTPISNTVPQYEDAGVAASGFFLKFYASGTTTPISMATDSTGGTLLAKAQLSTEGYPLNGSSAVFIPHIDRKYKIALFRNTADADANNLGNAVWPVDLLFPVITNDTLFTLDFDTLNDAVIDTFLLDGQVAQIKERTSGNGGGTIWDVVLSSTVTENTFNIVQCTGVPTLSLVIRDNVIATAEAWGIIADFNGTTGTDNALGIENAMAFSKELFFDKAGRYGHTGLTTPGAIFIRGLGSDKTSLEMFPLPTKITIFHSRENDTLKIRDITIDGSSVDGPFGGTGPFTEGVYCNLGNLDMDDCVVKRVNSYAIRSGNIEDNFDQTKKAGDVYIGGNVFVDQLTVAESLGDCMRIERTKRFVIEDGAKLNGGLSSLRIQFYVESIVVGDIVTKNNHGDVGITIALCTDWAINGSNNSGHARHGIELDGVRRGNVNGSLNQGNLKDGIVIAEFSPPVGASFEGFLDGVLITSSDVVVPEDIYVGGGTQCFNNGEFGARISRPNGVTFGDVKLKNNCSENVAFVDAAIFVTQGATVGGKDVQDITFTDAVSIVNNENQIRVMSINDYKSNAERSIKFVSRNIIGGSGERFQFPVTGTFNINADPFLSENADVTGTAVSAYDTPSVTGVAYLMDDTSGAGDLNLLLKLPSKLRFNNSLLIISHRTDVGTATLNVAVNLFNGGAFVETAFSAATTSTTAYFDFKTLVSPSSTSVVFDEVRVDLKTSIPEIAKIFVNRIDLFTQY